MREAEVGYRLGFEDPSYFSRFFPREVGASIVEFRLGKHATGYKALRRGGDCCPSIK